VAPQWLGWKQSPIEYIHAVKFYYELIRDGRVKIIKKIKGPVTYQEPCNVIRNAGYSDYLQYIIHAVCEEVVDPYPKGMHNYCCIAGGGVINCGPPYKLTMMKGNRVKAEQFAATGAHTIISP
jgi:Fe-S oxidoreductase